MHELSVAREIVGIVEDEMARRKLTRIKSVTIRLGALRGLHPDALSFGFEASVADTPLDGATLIIEQIPIRGKCRQCDKEFEVEEFLFICPQCDSGDLQVLAGEELDIDHFVAE